MTRPLVDGYGLPVRLVARSTPPREGGPRFVVRPMLKGTSGGEVSYIAPRLAPALEVGTFPVKTRAGDYKAVVRRMAGRLVLTLTGPRMQLPLHLIVRDASQAIRKAQMCADELAEGRAPPEGVFRADDVVLLAKGGQGGDLR